MKILLLYQFMQPDTVVSALHFSQLAQELSNSGHCVTAWPANRSCRKTGLRYVKNEIYKGVIYNRIYRLDLLNKVAFFRVVNAIWMFLSWSKIIFYFGKSKPDVIIIGTDPIFSNILRASKNYKTGHKNCSLGFRHVSRGRY